MVDRPLLFVESPVALRQPKTDRLVLLKYLKEAAADKRLNGGALKAAHAVLVKWADLETSGRLAELNETQMQGDFLAEVFGEALGLTDLPELRTGICNWDGLGGARKKG